jgi:hypothetical protein
MDARDVYVRDGRSAYARLSRLSRAAASAAESGSADRADAIDYAYARLYIASARRWREARGRARGRAL